MKTKTKTKEEKQINKLELVICVMWSIVFASVTVRKKENEQITSVTEQNISSLLNGCIFVQWYAQFVLSWLEQLCYYIKKTTLTTLIVKSVLLAQCKLHVTPQNQCEKTPKKKKNRICYL